MAQANLVNDRLTIDTSWDNIVIVDNFQSIRGGYTLDTTGFTPTFIRAGHPIIEETATGILKPMPVSNATTFAALPAGHTYAGVAIHSDFTKRPMAGITVRGTVNHIAFTNASAAGKEGYYSYTPILAAIKAALPLVDFRGDR